MLTRFLESHTWENQHTGKGTLCSQLEPSVVLDCEPGKPASKPYAIPHCGCHRWRLFLLSEGRASPALYTYRHCGPHNKEEAALAHKGNEDGALFNASDPDHNQLLWDRCLSSNFIHCSWNMIMWCLTLFLSDLRMTLWISVLTAI